MVSPWKRSMSAVLSFDIVAVIYLPKNCQIGQPLFFYLRSLFLKVGLQRNAGKLVKGQCGISFNNL